MGLLWTLRRAPRPLGEILGRGRWFFARITGRRRIGKTTLIQQALRQANSRPIFYVQIPDSAPAGVLSAVHDAMDTFELPSTFARPDSLLGLARLVEQLAQGGYVVALDEFQYFSRKHLSELTSHLQASVDRLSARADAVPGGLIVLGSLHAELVALLEDRDAPLYNGYCEIPPLDPLRAQRSAAAGLRRARPGPARGPARPRSTVLVGTSPPCTIRSRPRFERSNRDAKTRPPCLAALATRRYPRHQCM